MCEPIGFAKQLLIIVTSSFKKPAGRPPYDRTFWGSLIVEFRDGLSDRSEHHFNSGDGLSDLSEHHFNSGDGLSDRSEHHFNSGDGLSDRSEHHFNSGDGLSDLSEHHFNSGDGLPIGQSIKINS
jgi:hypothetical protein